MITHAALTLARVLRWAAPHPDCGCWTAALAAELAAVLVNADEPEAKVPPAWRRLLEPAPELPAEILAELPDGSPGLAALRVALLDLVHRRYACMDALSAWQAAHPEPEPPAHPFADACRAALAGEAAGEPR